MISQNEGMLRKQRRDLCHHRYLQMQGVRLGSVSVV
jgi:hypothetical protein